MNCYYLTQPRYGFANMLNERYPARPHEIGYACTLADGRVYFIQNSSFGKARVCAVFACIEDAEAMIFFYERLPVGRDLIKLFCDTQGARFAEAAGGIELDFYNLFYKIH